MRREKDLGAFICSSICELSVLVSGWTVFVLARSVCVCVCVKVCASLMCFHLSVFMCMCLSVPVTLLLVCVYVCVCSCVSACVQPVQVLLKCARSEERRVGKACRSRRSPYH